MIVRPGRLLPSVIVGALVTGALALGAGTASAAEPLTPAECEAAGGVPVLATGLCTIDGVTRDLVGAGSTSSGTETTTDTTPSAGSGGGSGSTAGDTVGGVVGGVTGGVVGGAGGAGSTAGSGSTTGSGSSSGSTTTTTGQGGGAGTATAPAQPVVVPAPVVVQRPAIIPAPDVRGTPAAFSSAPGGLAARIPALGPGIGLLNPGLLNPALLNVPLTQPLRTLVGQNGASPVTTTSDVQAMAFDNGPGSLGTPAIVGVLILAGLGGFALRHRVLRRARLAAAADTVETPVRA